MLRKNVKKKYVKKKYVLKSGNQWLNLYLYIVVFQYVCRIELYFNRLTYFYNWLRILQSLIYKYMLNIKYKYLL